MISRTPLPIKRIGQLIGLPVRVNRSDPLLFVLDSGFEESVLDPDAAAHIGLALGDRQRVSAPGGSTTYATLPQVTVSLEGDREIEQQHLAAVPLKHFRPFFGEEVDGILGYDFIERFVVHIDYARNTLTLSDPRDFDYTGSGVVLPLHLETRQPYIEARVVIAPGMAAHGRFEIDTGSMDALNLNRPFVEAHALFPPEYPMLKLRGVSLGGETVGLLTRVEQLQMGPVELRSPVTAIVNDEVERAGQIGGEVLRRFTVIFDYTRKRMILKPNAAFAAPFTWDMAGLMVVAEEPGLASYRVFLVVEESPAAEAGVCEGDRILVVDGRSAQKLTLQEVRDCFQQERVQHQLILQRGEERMPVQFVTRRLV